MRIILLSVTLSICLLLSIVSYLSEKPFLGLLPETNAGEAATILEYNDSPVSEARTDGEVIYSKDNNFLITVYPTQLVMDGDARRLWFNYCVENNSNKVFRKFTATLQPNKQHLDPYLAAGAFDVPNNTFDLYPIGSKGLGKEAGTGINSSWNTAITDDKRLQELGVNFEDIFQYASEYTIKLTWKGGKESILVKSPVIDKTSKGD